MTSTAYACRYAKLYSAGYRLTVSAEVPARMVRALRCIGYTNRDISEGADVGNDRFIGNLANGANTGPREKVYLATAKKIEAFYREHHMRPRDGVGAKRTITHAKKAGWSPPLAWDDITDLTERPKQ